MQNSKVLLILYWKYLTPDGSKCLVINLQQWITACQSSFQSIIFIQSESEPILFNTKILQENSYILLLSATATIHRWRRKKFEIIHHPRLCIERSTTSEWKLQVKILVTNWKVQSVSYDATAELDKAKTHHFVSLLWWTLNT